jgi:hypothetical protein
MNAGKSVLFKHVRRSIGFACPLTVAVFFRTVKGDFMSFRNQYGELG